jgi:superfamily II DNA or RNA helicase/diadenosine tetraphosphate (Ap4A) HIT family hydrolase
MSPAFLDKPRSEWVASNTLAFAVRDADPVSPGHTLVIARRPVASWREATSEERAALMALVDEVTCALERSHRPDGFHVGFDDGPAAGQSVPHLHLHVIPRYLGDAPDPRGGLRHVIPTAPVDPDRAPPLVTGGPDPFSAHLLPLLSRATDVSIVAAFARDSGLQRLRPALFSALARGARVRILTGDYLGITRASALRLLLDWTHQWEALDAEGARGTIEGRIIEVQSLDLRSFHPKSWRFEGPGFGAAFVGSSNLSATALEDGVEWNLRVERRRDPEAYAAVALAFDALWARARPLDLNWLASYREADRQPAPPPPEPPPAPHAVQQEALEALARARTRGFQRALVVLATGLGKTFLAAFDVHAFGADLDHPPRVLFVAHRAEILAQAAETFRRLFPDAAFSWFAGPHAELDGELVLASIQKLSRPEHLAALAPERFDYVVIDEVHHAAADSYRRLLERLRPAFLLGLTATPDRTDAADILGLFDDHLAFRADLGEGIRRGFLVPFHYHGLKDPTDFTPIPWRSGRFDVAALTGALATQRRMETLWEAWEEHPGGRTLVFCCSIQHAEFARDWLAARGVRVASVHTGPGAADRAASLAALEQGELDAITAVDLLNEGVDIKPIDRVVMLRPTESPVLFLQQLGRGLRRAAGKTSLTVLDFVGNHRVFLDRARTLLTLSAQPVVLRAWLAGKETLTLPDGCAVDIALEAIDLLSRFLPGYRDNAAVRAYRALREARGERPTAGELHRRGLSVRSLRHPQGWFGFVADEGDLDEAEHRALARCGDWLRALESTPSGLAAEPRERWPIGDESVEAALERMAAELTDLQRAREASRQSQPEGEAFTARVTWNQRDPILSLPERSRHPSLPSGETAVRLPDGSVWSFRFVKHFCNVARPSGVVENQLPTLLRRWFGAGAGQPGTREAVRFSPHPDGWWAEPATRQGSRPTVGTRLEEAELASAFGVSRPPAGEVDRVDGVLFLCIREAGRFTAPEQLTLTVSDRRDSETAQVLAEVEDGLWRCCGEARWEDGSWLLPALDFATWRRLGSGRGASRQLEERWLEEAEALTAQVLATHSGEVLEVDGKRFRVLKRTASGGVQIDGGPGGFKPRTVTPTDLGWVLKAQAALPPTTVLDEAAVNRQRYLEGTPRKSTRWIDTGHAIRLFNSLINR